MTSVKSLKLVRWGVRAALAWGVAASVAGNVLHAQDSAISRVISAWSPLALLITIELIARVPIRHRGLALARMAAAALIAGIAAWVSYWHMAAVAARYGETGASPYLIPLSVDGLVVVASVCLVELGGRIRDAEAEPAPKRPVDKPTRTGPVFDHAAPIGPEVAPVEGVKLTTLKPPKPAPRKPHPTAAEQVVKAHRRWPEMSNSDMAARLKLSLATVKRHRPERPAEQAPEAQQINGRKPDLEEVNN